MHGPPGVPAPCRNRVPSFPCRKLPEDNLWGRPQAARLVWDTRYRVCGWHSIEPQKRRGLLESEELAKAAAAAKAAAEAEAAKPLLLSQVDPSRAKFEDVKGGKIRVSFNGKSIDVTAAELFAHFAGWL